MIAFGLRLALRGGREAVIRLLATAAAVALGVGLLLMMLAGINGVTNQDARGAWLASGNPGLAAPGTKPAADPVWAMLSNDLYQGQEIDRVDVAVTGPQSPIPPGLTRLPGPGEYYASPALQKLIRSVPAAQLADRYPGRDVGTIGDAGLPSPGTLTIVVGHTPAELSHVHGVGRISTIATARDQRADDGVKLILAVTAAALIFPVLIFIGTATRLAAARREQRFAAMRLCGATPRQVSVVSAVESTVAAAIGTALGFVLFTAFRVPLSAAPFTGSRFQPADFSLTLADVLIVALGVPIAAAVAARVSLRRVRISPLGVSRRVRPSAPRAWRVLPLLLGVAELAYFVGRRPASTNGQIAAYLTGIFTMMFGLQIAGPWLTMTGARLMAGRANRVTTLIAARRLADDPKAGFRAISGLVLALFVTSTAIGVITSMVDNQGVPADMTRNPAATSTVTQTFWPTQGGSDKPVYTTPTAIPATVTQQILAVPGVQQVLTVHANPAGFGPQTAGSIPAPPGLVTCADLARTSGLGRCATGATVAGVSPDLTEFGMGPRAAAGSAIVWPSAADVSPARLGTLPILSVVVATDGSATAIEQTRTRLEAAYPLQQNSPSTQTEYFAMQSARLTGYQQLAEVVILVSLVIAGCSLALSVVGGLNERKRPFSLLRLTGVQLATLRRIVGLETTVPLLGVAVVATGAGFLAAGLFLRAQLAYSLEPPGIAYYATVGAGLAATLAIIASTLPLLRRITGPETARNE